MAYDIAIPEDDSRTLQDYLDALRRRGATALKLAAAVLIVGLVVIFLWPNTYRSTATILIEDPEIPPGLVPTTVTTFAARQVQYINQRVMTRTNLAQIIEKFNLYPDERKYLPTLLLVEDVQKERQDRRHRCADARPADRDGEEHDHRLQCGLRAPGPQHRAAGGQRARLPVPRRERAGPHRADGADQPVHAGRSGSPRRRGARLSNRRWPSSSRRTRAHCREQSEFNLQFLQRTDADILEVERQLRTIDESKIILDAQLAQIEPMAAMVTPEGKGVAPPTDQLRALKSQLAMLEARYSPDHPDVVRTRRDVEAMEAEVGDVDPKDTEAQLTELRAQLARAKERYSDDHPEVIALKRQIKGLEDRQAAAASRPAGSRAGKQEPNNPAYIQVQAQRKALDAQQACADPGEGRAAEPRSPTTRSA